MNRSNIQRILRTLFFQEEVADGVSGLSALMSLTSWLKVLSTLIFILQLLQLHTSLCVEEDQPDFHVCASESCCQLLSFFSSHYSVVSQISFVGNNNHWTGQLLVLLK